MSDLLAKISSYNIFNYLLPGVVFATVANLWTGISFIPQNIIADAFIYYFIGMVISRIGSLIVEPVLKLIRFVHFADYAAFVKASAKDSKIEILSEANNSYRTMASAFLTLCGLKIYLLVTQSIPILRQSGIFVGAVLLLILFLFSYRKQTAYIVKRIKANG